MYRSRVAAYCPHAPLPAAPLLHAWAELIERRLPEALLHGIYFPCAEHRVTCFVIVSRPMKATRFIKSLYKGEQPPRRALDRFIKLEHHHCRPHPSPEAVPELSFDRESIFRNEQDAEST